MKILFHIPTGTLHPINRDDGAPVYALDADYLECDLIQLDAPKYDEQTHTLTATQSIDTAARTVTRGWQITERQLTQGEILRARRAAMASAFDALPVAVQAAFWTTRVSAESAMDRGRFDIARALIESQPVPPELESTKAAILAHFP